MQLYDAQKAADILDVSPTTIRRLWNTGQLASIRIGRARRVSHTELTRWAHDNETTETP